MAYNLFTQLSQKMTLLYANSINFVETHFEEQYIIKSVYNEMSFDQVLNQGFFSGFPEISALASKEVE